MTKIEALKAELGDELVKQVLDRTISAEQALNALGISQKTLDSRIEARVKSAAETVETEEVETAEVETVETEVTEVETEVVETEVEELVTKEVEEVAEAVEETAVVVDEPVLETSEFVTADQLAGFMTEMKEFFTTEVVAKTAATLNVDSINEKLATLLTEVEAIKTLPEAVQSIREDVDTLLESDDSRLANNFFGKAFDEVHQPTKKATEDSTTVDALLAEVETDDSNAWLSESFGSIFKENL